VVCLYTKAKAEHLRTCEDCRRTAYVWYLRENGVQPLPPDRKDGLRVRLRHWWERRGR
jgi:hypothetical protein